MSAAVAVGIDLGATNLKGAVVDKAAHILAKRSRPSSGLSPDQCVRAIVELVNQLLSEAAIARNRLVGVGVGSPGPLSQRSGRIIRSPNLPGWVDVPLRDMIAERLGVTVVLDNDGNAAAYGEYWARSRNAAGTAASPQHDPGFGAANSGDLVMLTLGSGVGAGVVLGGRVLHGHFENAAELGHMIVAVDGLPCPCGQRGCLEQYASASAIGRRVRQAVEAGESSALAGTARHGMEPDSKDVVAHARDGDALCLRVFDEACRYLAVACVNIQHAFNPSVIVLGGGLSEAGAFLLDRVRSHFVRQEWSLYDDAPAIELAQLGYDAGAIGAAGLAWRASET